MELPSDQDVSDPALELIRKHLLETDYCEDDRSETLLPNPIQDSTYPKSDIALLRNETEEEPVQNNVKDEAFDDDVTTAVVPETLQNERATLQLSNEDSFMDVRPNKLMTNFDPATSPERRISSNGETSEEEREYRTSNVSLSREVLVKHFGKKLEHAAQSLGVSRSTMKRACRVHGIKKWPFPKRKNVQPSPSNLKHVKRRAKYGPKQLPRFSSSEPSCSNPAPMNTTSLDSRMISNVIQKQGEGSVIVKATYGDEIIRFQLGCSSKKTDLMEKVTLRLPLKEGSFNIKYEDDYGDWVLIACDEDLDECMDLYKGKSYIKMLVQLKKDHALI